MHTHFFEMNFHDPAPSSLNLQSAHECTQWFAYRQHVMFTNFSLYILDIMNNSITLTALYSIYQLKASHDGVKCHYLSYVLRVNTTATDKGCRDRQTDIHTCVILKVCDNDCTAMGTRMAPSYANLFMGFLHSAIEKPSLWLCFINDIFLLWPHGPNSLAQFLECLNGS